MPISGSDWSADNGVVLLTSYDALDMDSGPFNSAYFVSEMKRSVTWRPAASKTTLTLSPDDRLCLVPRISCSTRCRSRYIRTRWQYYIGPRFTERFSMTYWPNFMIRTSVGTTIVECQRMCPLCVRFYVMNIWKWQFRVKYRSVENVRVASAIALALTLSDTLS